GWASAWPSWATPRITLLKDFWIPFARRRMPEPRFLVVRLGSLGDIVHTFPAVAGLRESFPKAEIVWLTHPRWKALVESSELATALRRLCSRCPRFKKSSYCNSCEDLALSGTSY